MSVTDVGGDKRIFCGRPRSHQDRGPHGYVHLQSGSRQHGLGVGSMLYYGPAFYPQGDLIWGCIIASAWPWR